MRFWRGIVRGAVSSTRKLKTSAVVAALSFMIVFLMIEQGNARQCFEDTIQSKSDDGDILVMLSGAVYEVDAGDQIDSALWLETDNVLICQTVVNYQGRPVVLFDIINTDENGEKVGAQKLR
jgi:hypothetical protein